MATSDAAHLAVLWSMLKKRSLCLTCIMKEVTVKICKYCIAHERAICHSPLIHNFTGVRKNVKDR